MVDTSKSVVIVSGGSRGLGQAIVTDFLERGHIVATFSRSATPFIETLRKRDPDGDTFYWESLDTTDHPRVKKFVLSMARRFGRIDTLINNAGVGTDGVLALMRPDEIRGLISVNLEATIWLSQACVRVMLTQGSGNILSISSVTASHGIRGVSVYSATKAALEGFSRSLAREVGSKGIRVNALAPGYFESDMVGELSEERRREIERRTPLRRLARPEDIVGAIRFLTSPEADFITGQTIVVDGGFTC